MAVVVLVVVARLDEYPFHAVPCKHRTFVLPKCNGCFFPVYEEIVLVFLRVWVRETEAVM